MFAILDSDRPPGFGMPILSLGHSTDGDELGPPASSSLGGKAARHPDPSPPFLSEIGCLGKLSRQLLPPLLPLKQILEFAQNWKATGEGPRHSYVSSEHISSSLRSFWGTFTHEVRTLVGRGFGPKVDPFPDRLRECDL